MPTALRPWRWPAWKALLFLAPQFGRGVENRPRRLDGLKERAPGLHRFLTRQDSPWPLIRDVAIGGLVLLLVLSSLWVYTGRWGHSPVVVVESGSMMHCSNGIGGSASIGRECDSSRFGRLGTIDPGDLILVQEANGRDDIETYAGGGQDRYGEPGDVIVYKPNGEGLNVPVIHRAMFWLQVEADGSYTLPELGATRVRSLDVDDLGLDREEYRLGPSCQEVAWPHNLRPGMAGFVTKGDNNECFDQSSSGLQYLVVEEDWVVGKARGEIPWLGLVKLFVTDTLNTILGRPHEPNYHNASGDTKIILWVGLAVLIGGPYVYEKTKHARQRREREASGPATKPGEPAIKTRDVDLKKK